MKSFMVLQTLFVDELPLAEATCEPLASVMSHVAGQVGFVWETALTFRTLEGVDASVDGVDMFFKRRSITQLLSTNCAGKYGIIATATCVLPSVSRCHLERDWILVNTQEYTYKWYWQEAHFAYICTCVLYQQPMYTHDKYTMQAIFNLHL